MFRFDFSEALAKSVKKGRNEARLTQKDVSIILDMDYRTYQHMEDGTGNPSMDKLYKVIRLFKSDPRDFFYPELSRESSVYEQLQMILEDCSDEEIEILIPVVTVVINGLRRKAKEPIPVEKSEEPPPTN